MKDTKLLLPGEGGDGEYLEVTIGIPYGLRPKKTFQFCLDDSVWTAKQAVLLEFSQMNLSDPLNFGFYMPPYNGRAGKFLDEERPLRDYPMSKDQPFLEFRYKRRIFRSIGIDEKRLLKINSKTQQRKFIEHIQTGNVEKVAALLERGLDPNFQDDKIGDMPLSCAVLSPRSVELLTLLVSKGSHLDYRTPEGLTALHKAAIVGNADAIKGLLDLGASPNYKDAKGLTPVYHCVLEGSDPYCCELLLSEYAELGIVDHQGIQEVHQACRKGHAIHLEYLLYYGVDVNARTASGNTPLHICALSNQRACAKVLLCRGAQRDTPNYSNQSAYEVAILAGNQEVATEIKDFQDSEIVPFNTKPKYIERRRGTRVLARVRSFENLLTTPSPCLKRAISDSGMDARLLRVPSSDVTLKCPEKSNLLRDSAIDNESEESGSEESDSDEGVVTRKRRTFSNAGVGTPRAPAPIKANPGGSAQMRNRLYASVPGRHFVAVMDYKPKAPGELGLEKGDSVEVLYVGEQGFWEGRVGGKAGWFPSSCVHEVKRGKKMRPKTWFGTKKTSSLEFLQKVSKYEDQLPRSVTLKRNDKGFGFQLRGANSQVSRIEFSPTSHYPALQYIGEVDKGGVADKAGLKPGDFVLEVNGEDITNASHGYAVSVISKGGKVLNMKVITVQPDASCHDAAVAEAAKTSPDRRERTNSVEKKLPPPKPPTRSPYTCLTMGRASGTLLQATKDEVGTVPMKETVMKLEKRGLNRNSSVKSIWSEAAWKLRIHDPTPFQGENISHGMARRSDDTVRAMEKRDDTVHGMEKRDDTVRGMGMLRRDKTKSLDFDGQLAVYDDTALITDNSRIRPGFVHSYSTDVACDLRPIGVNYPGYFTLPRKSARKLSEPGEQDHRSASQSHALPPAGDQDASSISVSEDARPYNPPDYEYALHNLRMMGRRPAYSFEESRKGLQSDGAPTLPRRNTVPAGLDQSSSSVAPNMDSRHVSRFPGENPGHKDLSSVVYVGHDPARSHTEYRTLPRSISQPVRCDVHAPSATYQENASVKRSDSEPFYPEVIDGSSDFAKSLVSAVKKRNSRVLESKRSIDDIVEERRKSVVAIENPSTSKPLDDSTLGTNLEVKVSHIGDESPKGKTKFTGAEALLQRRDSKGSDYFSLYTSSSTASLDSQCSKDSGIDTSPLGLAHDSPVDHASALAHAVAMRAARLATKETKDTNEARKGCIVGESVDNVLSPPCIEEVSLLRPSTLLQDRRQMEHAASTMPVSDVEQRGTSTFNNESIEVDDVVMAAGMPYSGTNQTAAKFAPPTKPKPTVERRAPMQSFSSRDSKLAVVLEDPKVPMPSAAPEVDASIQLKNKSLPEQGVQLARVGNLSEASSFNICVGRMSDEDLATMYLDEVISEAAATIDYDLVSLRSLRLDSPQNRGHSHPPPVKAKPDRMLSPTSALISSITNANAATKMDDPAVITLPPPPPADSFPVPNEFNSDVPPPLMFSSPPISSAQTISISPPSLSSPPPTIDTLLPPPPDDFLDNNFHANDISHQVSLDLASSVRDAREPPPPYSPPRVCNENVPEPLSAKPYTEWTSDDVSSWLDYIKMAQYKSAFLENDIQGVHLPDLTKEDLAELGIKKLGHRLTIDDAIAKLCRALTEV